MSTPQLTAEQRKRIHGYVSSFREYLNSPEGRRDTQDRLYRRQFFQSFTPEKLAKLEETDLAELVTHSETSVTSWSACSQKTDFPNCGKRSRSSCGGKARFMSDTRGF